MEQENQKMTLHSRTLPVLKDGSIRRELAKVQTFRDAIALRSKYPSLGRIENEVGIEAVEQYISVNLKFITDIIGLEFNEAQFEDGIQSILLIRWLTIADLKAFLEHCKRHKFYYRDYKEFLDVFQDYVNESLDTAEGDNYHKHLDIKAQEAQFGDNSNRTQSLGDVIKEIRRQ